MVEVYGTPVCGWCKKAVELSETYGLDVKYIDITASEEALDNFKQKFPGAMTVPQIIWNGTHFKSYTEFSEEVANTRNYGDGQV